MKSSSQDGLRANQKARTRTAIVDAATALLRAGTTLSVAEAADEAKVSRATAYRYFPTQEALMVEIADLSPAVQPVEELVATLTGDDVEARLLRLLDAFNAIVFDDEVRMRTALRIYLDTWLESRNKGDAAPAVREGRRMRWLDQALEPARRSLSKAQWQRLRCALALTLSMDAMVVMKDVCGVKDNDQALAILRWAAQSLLAAGLEQGRASTGRRAKRADKTA